MRLIHFRKRGTNKSQLTLKVLGIKMATHEFEAQIDEVGIEYIGLAVIPYFIIYARDLVQTGYRISDVFRVSALSLLLVPVNLGGVFKSLQQILTGKRTPFGRTPKISDRTAVPLVYLAAVYGFTAYCMISFIMDIQAARWMHATFSIINGGILAYAIYRFIGLQESWQDIGHALSRSKHLRTESIPHMEPAQSPFIASGEMLSHDEQQAS